MDEIEIEEGWPFFEIHFPNCQPLICSKHEVCDFITDQMDYLEDGEIIIKPCNLSKEELKELPEHMGC